jgi:hypothetical protein
MLSPDTKLYLFRYGKTKQVKTSTKHEKLPSQLIGDLSSAKHNFLSLS